MKRILLGVSGSIAAYKAADLASRLTHNGHSVTVVMTSDAREFITPLTLQVLSKNPVVSGIYDEKESWRPGHIALADESDLILVAPATANIVAKFANGIADDIVSTTLSICDVPKIFAPAIIKNFVLFIFSILSSVSSSH